MAKKVKKEKKVKKSSEAPRRPGESDLSYFIRVKVARVPYEIFKNIKAPSWLEKVTDLILSKIRIPQLSQIIKVAYEVSKDVETKKMSGLAKKGEVVKAIESFTSLIGVKLPTVMKNLINEMVAVYVKMGF